MKVKRALFKRYYSQYPVNGFIYRDVVHANCRKEHLILDFGAGRGVNNWIIPKENNVYGVDIDVSLLENPRLSEKKLLKDDKIPYPDHHFDLVLSTWVVEHLPHPINSFSEINRVLKPGGKFIFLTSNRFHYVSLIAAITPQWFHEFIIPKIRGRIPDDVFPTCYKANTLRSIKRIAKLTHFDPVQLISREPPPVYLGFSSVTFHLGRMYQRLVTKYDFLRPFRHGIIGVLEKRSEVVSE